jgi:hypothetical protein
MRRKTPTPSALDVVTTDLNSVFKAVDLVENVADKLGADVETKKTVKNTFLYGGLLLAGFFIIKKLSK